MKSLLTIIAVVVFAGVVSAQEVQEISGNAKLDTTTHSSSTTKPMTKKDDVKTETKKQPEVIKVISSKELQEATKKIEMEAEKKKDAQAIEQRKLMSKPYPIQEKTKTALGQSTKWIKKDATVYQAGAGRIKYTYGQTMPEIVTAPFYVTDIALEPGETVQEIMAGDNVRWNIRVSVSGHKTKNKRSHILIKPIDAGLQTSLAIMTDKRSYHILLSSTKKQYMPMVGFVYPANQAAQIEAAKKLMAVEHVKKEKKETLSTGQRILNLDFGYSVEGTASWTPSRVYSDEGRMYIELPQSIRAKNAPVLFANGNGDAKKMEVVNYDVKGTKYIVHGLYDNLMLVSGVGGKQASVNITKNK